MVHGWPGMWSTWARQITHFQVSYALMPLPSDGGYLNIVIETRALDYFSHFLFRMTTVSLLLIFVDFTNLLIRAMCIQAVFTLTLCLT